MTTLTAARRPLVSSHMSINEVIDEAEHTFVSPSPLIQMMLFYLRKSEVMRGGPRRYDGPTDISTQAQPEGVHCPSCGAQLHLERNETESE